jgi:dihydroflavonol-4-reductase
MTNSTLDFETCYVTGGGGFLGGHLVGQLLACGHRVIVLERPGFDASNMPGNIDLRLADIRHRDAVQRALADCSGASVFHLAANPHLWAADKQEFDAVNHRGTVHVLESALAGGAKRVLHCSTESILTKARWPRGQAIDEQVEISEADAVGPYCLSKLRAENFALSLARAGRPVVVANPTMPVGPNDPGPSPPTCLIRDFIEGRMPGYMDCALNLVDARDVATGLVRVMQAGQPGRRHLLSGENLTLHGLLQILSRFTDRPVPRFNIPYPVGLTYAYLSEWVADHLTHTRPQATVTGLRLARRVMHFDASATRQLVGWSPRPVEESLRDALEWLGISIANQPLAE